ncbi:hypothetical protein [Methylocapsa palsarum]|uniref:Uncharacterized protein n=1 Tax=Methylocapsa palsarum TaxID=1612308 RepID=A0A1I4BJS6_9HYPH|nr:hypothetical protein [Methylocapsa palsarum]SFK69074.1 hypothetical protein SAMN05444581_11557 [Methylocapsa palsarum]
MIEPVNANYEFDPPEHAKHFWLRQIPYLAAFLFTLIGVGYTSVARQPLTGYWEFMAMFMCAVCVNAGWTRAHKKDAVGQLVWTQVVHWGVFLVAMNLVLLPSVQKMTDADTIGLMMLLLLALATFISGIHLLSWQICVLGVLMALGVPGIAWLENSALLLVFGAVSLAGFAGFIWWRSRRHEA